jgi:hypothetical protein
MFGVVLVVSTEARRPRVEIVFLGVGRFSVGRIDQTEAPWLFCLYGSRTA